MSLSLEILENAEYFVAARLTTDIITPQFIKKLRQELDMSINVFSSAIGASPREVRGWERGRKIHNSIKILLYLIQQDKTLIDKFYRFYKEGGSNERENNCER